MTIGAMKMNERVHCNGEPTRGWLLASWHWAWSLTWSWVLDWYPHVSDMPKAFYIKTNGGCICGLRIPIIGDLHFQKQASVRR